MSRLGGRGVVLIIGGAFAAIGLLFMVVFGQRTTLDCQRLESILVECRIQRDFLGLPVADEQVRQVQGATVAVSSDSDGDTYRVELYGASGTVPLTVYYSSGSRGKYELAEEINAFLAEPARPAYQASQMSWFGLLFSGVFAAIGLLFLAGLLVDLFVRSRGPANG